MPSAAAVNCTQMRKRPPQTTGGWDAYGDKVTAPGDRFTVAIPVPVSMQFMAQILLHRDTDETAPSGGADDRDATAAPFRMGRVEATTLLDETLGELRGRPRTLATRIVGGSSAAALGAVLSAVGVDTVGALLFWCGVLTLLYTVELPRMGQMIRILEGSAVDARLVRSVSGPDDLGLASGGAVTLAFDGTTPEHLDHGADRCGEPVQVFAEAGRRTFVPGAHGRLHEVTQAWRPPGSNDGFEFGRRPLGSLGAPPEGVGTDRRGHPVARLLIPSASATGALPSRVRVHGWRVNAALALVTVTIPLIFGGSFGKDATVSRVFSEGCS